MRRFELLSGHSGIRHLVVATFLSLGVASAGKAAVLIGGFQGPADPTDAGWTDQQSSDPISADPNATFPATGVPGYPLSLELAKQGLAAGFGNPSSLQIQFSPAQKLAFNANSFLTFTFSVPTGTATAGYNQIYNIVVNAPGYGYNNFMDGGNAAATWGTYSQSESVAGLGTAANQNGEPNFYIYPGDPALDSETVTINYSSILPAIIAGGEGYIQITFTGNTGGGAPAVQDFNNVVLSTAAFGADAPVPEPASIGILGLTVVGLLRRRNRRA